MRKSTKLIFFLIYPNAFHLYCLHKDFFEIYERYFNTLDMYNYYSFIQNGSTPLNQMININSTFNSSDLYIKMSENISIKNIYNPKIFISLP